MMSVLRLACSFINKTTFVAFNRQLIKSYRILSIGCATLNNTTVSLHNHNQPCLLTKCVLNCNVTALCCRTYCNNASDVEPTNKSTDNKGTDPDSLRLIYRFSRINMTRLLQRWKLYQTSFGCIFVPMLSVGYMNGAVPLDEYASVVSVYVAATSLLWAFSPVVSKIVCLLKYDDVKHVVHIAHLTMWGKRRDVEIPIENIIPESENNKKPHRSIVRVDTYDKTESFILLLEKSSPAVVKDIKAILD